MKFFSKIKTQATTATEYNSCVTRVFGRVSVRIKGINTWKGLEQLILAVSISSVAEAL